MYKTIYASIQYRLSPFQSCIVHGDLLERSLKVCWEGPTHLNLIIPHMAIVYIVYHIIILSNISASIVRGTRVFQPQPFQLYQPLCSLWYKMYACHRTGHQRQKRTGVGEIIASRTIKIMARTGTSGTTADTGTIPIIYGCLIPLGLLNWTPPTAEP